jgi:hypothetical protein
VLNFRREKQALKIEGTEMNQQQTLNYNEKYLKLKMYKALRVHVPVVAKNILNKVRKSAKQFFKHNYSIQFIL